MAAVIGSDVELDRLTRAADTWYAEASKRSPHWSLDAENTALHELHEAAEAWAERS